MYEASYEGHQEHVLYLCKSAYSFESTPLFGASLSEPPNTRETGSGVYIYIYILNFIYLFVRDLAWQRLNAHAQTPRGRPYCDR